MKKPFWALFVASFFTLASAQTVQKDSETQRAICGAAAPKLQEGRTNQVVLMLTLNRNGRVQSFKTETPKGLKLEKMTEVAAKIKAIPFSPAKKDGSPVAVQVRIAVDCTSQPVSTP